MESTLHTDPTRVHRDAPTAVVLAHATLALDEVVKTGHEAQQQWSLTQRSLSAMVLQIMVQDTGYMLPPVVREALGGNFYEGTLISEAIRLGWLRVLPIDGEGVGFNEYEVTDASPWDEVDLLTALRDVGRIDE